MHLSFKAILSLGVILPIVMGLPHHDVRAADADGTVLTPVGLRPKSSAAEIPHDAKLNFTDDEIHIVFNNGTIHRRFPHVSSGVKPAPAFSTGYVAYAYYVGPATGSISSFTTNWPVPPNPTTNNGQTVFLFNGLVPDDSASILQPVLQWGSSAAGGGPTWQVASWFVGPSGTFWTELVDVSVGQALSGIMTVDTAANTYTSSFVGITKSSLTIANGPRLTRAYEALEAYNIQAKSNYPVGTTPFTNINLVGPPSVSWTAVSTPADGLTTTVVTDGGVNGRIDVHYT